MKIEESLSLLYEANGNFKLAHEHFKIYSQLKDSIFNMEKEKDITRKAMNYEFEKKEAATKAGRDKEIAVAEIQQKRRAITILSVISGMFLVFVISVMIFRLLRFTRKRNKIIEEQKEEVDIQRKIVEGQKHTIEEKQKEILDSIHYARNIQQAVLKGEAYIKNCLNTDHFILFKPKDIVSGDFYWLNKQGNKIIIAVGDCTGHGVPGGFMTMLGTSFLKEIVEKKGLMDPAQILTEMHKAVLYSLNQTSNKEEVRDGMEMALCCIDTINKTLEFSGAMSSIYIMQDGKLKKIEGDYYSIGGMSLFEKETTVRFTNKSISLDKNAVLYLFTDGYADQFGGEKMEKFNLDRFEQLLLSNGLESMATQREKLNDALDNWMESEFTQMDDILVMGIKI